MKRRRVLLFHGIVAPYRHSLFAELANRVNLRVLYATVITRDRHWDSSIPDTYDSRVLDGPTLYGVGRPLRLCPRLIAEVREFQPDVIVSVLTRSHAIDVARLASWCRRRRVPLLLWVGDIPKVPGCYDVPGLLSAPLRWLQNFALRRASGFVCYSQLSRQWILDRGVPVRKVAIGTQCFESPELIPRLDVKGRPKRFQLVFVGKHEVRKGLSTLIDALRRLPRELRDRLALITAGDGPLAGALRRSCPSGMELRMLGFQRREAMAKLYLNADATIVPSLYDPWANVVNESMALGTPVIVSRQCGSVELAAGTGWMVDGYDAGSVAQGIVVAMRQARSRQRRQLAVNAEAAYRPAVAAHRIAALVESL